MRCAALLLLVLASCGLRPMGATCRSSETCAGDGVCLKGVCSGYGCETDQDCASELECGAVFGTRSCLRACASDGDCLGEQVCIEVEEGLDEGGGTARYCL